MPKGLLSRGKINLTVSYSILSLLSPLSLSSVLRYRSSSFSLRLDRSENDGRLAPRVKGKASGRLHGGGRSTRQHGAVHGSKRLSPPYVTRVRRLSRALFYPRVSPFFSHSLSFSLFLATSRPPSPVWIIVDAFCGTRFENRWIGNLLGSSKRFSFWDPSRSLTRLRGMIWNYLDV